MISYIRLISYFCEIEHRRDKLNTQTLEKQALQPSPSRKQRFCHHRLLIGSIFRKIKRGTLFRVQKTSTPQVVNKLSDISRISLDKITSLGLSCTAKTNAIIFLQHWSKGTFGTAFTNLEKRVNVVHVQISMYSLTFYMYTLRIVF